MRININYKIALIFIAIQGFILSGIYIYLNNNLTEFTYNRIENNIRRELSYVRSVLENHGNEKQNSYNIDEVADETGKSLDRRVTIIGIDGTVFGDSELKGKELREVENHLYRQEVQEALKKEIGKSIRFSTTVKKHMLYVASVFGKNKPEGIIRLSVSLAEAEAVSDNIKKILIIAIMVGFLFAIFISFIISTLIIKPIKQISLAAGDMAHGDLSRRVTVRTNDEIEDLAKAFNYMSEQIKTKMEEVTRNKTRIEAVFLSMFDGVIVIDRKSNIVLINETLERLLEVNKNPIGKRPLEVIRNIELQEISDNALKTEKGVISREISVFMPEEKIFVIHATPIVEQGKSLGAVLVFHDITDLRQLEKVRRDFVANVSHELRTPISNIKGYAETLLEGAINDKKNAQDFLEIIHSDAERLATLINDILDLSKVESGKLAMELKPYSIKLIITRVVSALSKQAKSKSISVEVNIPEDFPSVMVDETKMTQVFFNLLDNAIKYTEKNGKIEVTGLLRSNSVEISVADNGIGIPEEDLPRIFERFYRVDKARSRELGGTGLGLAIVKHIAQAHNGSVRIKSILGKGSTFTVELPRI